MVTTTTIKQHHFSLRPASHCFSDGCQDVGVVGIEVKGRDELAGGMSASGTSTTDAGRSAR